jgi:hypothetical protein
MVAPRAFEWTSSVRELVADSRVIMSVMVTVIL